MIQEVVHGILSYLGAKDLDLIATMGVGGSKDHMLSSVARSVINKRGLELLGAELVESSTDLAGDLATAETVERALSDICTPGDFLRCRNELVGPVCDSMQMWRFIRDKFHGQLGTDRDAMAHVLLNVSRRFGSSDSMALDMIDLLDYVMLTRPRPDDMMGLATECMAAVARRYGVDLEMDDDVDEEWELSRVLETDDWRRFVQSRPRALIACLRRHLRLASRDEADHEETMQHMITQYALDSSSFFFSPVSLVLFF
jgi:hypothetical protein